METLREPNKPHNLPRTLESVRYCDVSAIEPDSFIGAFDEVIDEFSEGDKALYMNLLRQRAREQSTEAKRKELSPTQPAEQDKAAHKRLEFFETTPYAYSVAQTMKKRYKSFVKHPGADPYLVERAAFAELEAITSHAAEAPDVMDLVEKLEVRVENRLQSRGGMLAKLATEQSSTIKEAGERANQRSEKLLSSLGEQSTAREDGEGTKHSIDFIEKLRLNPSFRDEVRSSIDEQAVRELAMISRKVLSIYGRLDKWAGDYEKRKTFQGEVGERLMRINSSLSTEEQPLPIVDIAGGEEEMSLLRDALDPEQLPRDVIAKYSESLKSKDIQAAKDRLQRTWDRFGKLGAVLEID